MYLRSLSLLNFKNITQAEVELTPGINCFVGRNGAGKTNIIDSIYYLSMCKSSLPMTDGQSVRMGEEFFMLTGEYTSSAERRESVVCSFKRGGGKKVKRGGKEYERLADHIGIVPVVIVSPNDLFLINDAADERRRWLNGFISQLDREYLEVTIKYNHILGERNKLLKMLAGRTDSELLEVLDAQLVAAGEVIHKRRTECIAELQPLIKEYYSIISGSREDVDLIYKSELNSADFATLLTAARAKDSINQHTTTGIHRDDMVMRIGGQPLKKYGSQGQQKSFLIALKLAQHTIISSSKGECPILLLDDLFDKLDTSRLTKLIELTCDTRFGQIFISDCNGERLEAILNSCGIEYSLFTVEGGEVNREK